VPEARSLAGVCRYRGQGQAIDFIATDLLKITNRRITDNWHIEDNLTLLAQMGVDKVEQ
jgi:SnoaL-like polyketide cyclase